MNKKLVWYSIVSIFFLAWGATGFTSGRAHGALMVQSMVSHSGTPVVSQEAEPAMIPVTGESQPGWGILILFGMIVLATLTLILALLDFANQSTALPGRKKVSDKSGPGN